VLVRHLTRLLITLALSLCLLVGMAEIGPLSASADPSGGPSASNGSSPSASSSGSSSAGSSSTPSRKASTTSSPRSTAPKQRRAIAAAPRTDDSTAQTTFSDGGTPTNPSIVVHPDFKFEVNKPYVPGNPNSTPAAWGFKCKIDRPGQPGTWGECNADRDTLNTTGAPKTVGHRPTDMNPAPGLNTFSVQAYTFLAGQEVDASTTASYSWRVYSVAGYKPSFHPFTGPSFNNPISTKAAGRRSLTRVIRTINSMPGYSEPAHSGAPCPLVNSPQMPGVIRISLYSMTDGAFASAMKAANARCLSVQILMNNHLNRSNDPAWRSLENALGASTKHGDGTYKRSFAHRCHYACRGGGVLHTKMYLFDSRLPAPYSTNRTRITYTGSSNMTSNASLIQWNDLYGVNNNLDLFQIFNTYFVKMRMDNGYHRNSYKGFSTPDGRYNVVFWPVTKGHDPEMDAMRSIHCSGATGGTGVHGHTLVYINMHAWFGLRGLAFQRQVRKLYSQGCYVRILYSFMTKRVWYRLKHGTNGRMELRRTIFSLDGNRYADVYSHYKNILVSGHWAGDTNAKIVWTGSNNFTPDGTNFDEVMMRIRSATAYGQYARQWNYMKRRKSSATYASFLEPIGGGRAPFAATTGAPGTTGDTPTILSPDVTRAPDGTPRALD
jgi:hypothetical protein